MFGNKKRLENIDKDLCIISSKIEEIICKLMQDEKCMVHNTLQLKIDVLDDNFKRLNIMMNEFKGLVAIVRGEAAMRKKPGRPKKQVSNDNI